MKKFGYNPVFYPLSTYGLVNILLICLTLILFGILNVIASKLTIYIYFFRGFRIIGLAALGYFFMYLNECMLDSSNGGTTAPSIIPGRGGIDDLIDELTWALLPLLVCFLPSVLFAVFTSGNFEAAYTAIFAAGVLLFPMLAIRAAMMRTYSALNPIAAIFNILRFLPAYILLLLKMTAVFFPILLIILFQVKAGWAKVLAVPWMVYGCIVFWHLMGRFYFRCKEKLNWE